MRNSFAPFSLLFLWLQLAPHPRAALYEYGVLALLFTNTAVRVNGTNQADKSSRLFYRLNHKQSTDDANGKSADKRVGDITGESFKQIIKHDWEPLFNLMLVVCTFLAATTFSIYRLKMEFQLDKESRQNK